MRASGHALMVGFALATGVACAGAGTGLSQSRLNESGSKTLKDLFLSDAERHAREVGAICQDAAASIIGRDPKTLDFDKLSFTEIFVYRVEICTCFSFRQIKVPDCQKGIMPYRFHDGPPLNLNIEGPV